MAAGGWRARSALGQASTGRAATAMQAVAGVRRDAGGLGQLAVLAGAAVDDAGDPEWAAVLTQPTAPSRTAAGRLGTGEHGPARRTPSPPWPARRCESRGAHWRADYPVPHADWRPARWCSYSRRRTVVGHLAAGGPASAGQPAGRRTPPVAGPTRLGGASGGRPGELQPPPPCRDVPHRPGAPLGRAARARAAARWPRTSSRATPRVPRSAPGRPERPSSPVNPAWWPAWSLLQLVLDEVSRQLGTGPGRATLFALDGDPVGAGDSSGRAGGAGRHAAGRRAHRCSTWSRHLSGMATVDGRGRCRPSPAPERS